MKKENSYELIGSEREKIQDRVYLFLFPRTPFVSCACKTKEEARRASLRATGFPRTYVCVHKTPRGRGGGGGKERPKFRLLDIIPFTR